MANEDIEIRITKNGQIFVRIEGASEERLRDFRAFLEETVGTVTFEMPIDRPDWEKPAELTTEEKQQRELEH